MLSPRHGQNYAAVWQLVGHSLEPQRYWCPGANCYPFPSKTIPARQQEVFQQGQLGGSMTQGCLSACSSLEVQY